MRRRSNPSPKKTLIFTCLQYKSSENIVGKGEIACSKQILLFPLCFLPIWRTFCHFHQIWNCCLQTLSVGKSLKFVLWERVNTSIQNIHPVQLVQPAQAIPYFCFWWTFFTSKDQSNIGSSWFLTLSQTTNFRLYLTEKVCTDDSFEIYENGRMFSKWMENIMGKVACYEQFLLFPVFSKAVCCRHVKTSVCMGKG